MDKELILARLLPQDIYGSEMKMNSKGFVMRCPFHEDTEPSFQVYADNKSFRCFGCGKSGSAFDFVMRKDNMEFPDALRCLAEKAGISPEDTRHPSERLFVLNNAVQKIYTDRTKQIGPDRFAPRAKAPDKELDREQTGRFYE